MPIQVNSTGFSAGGQIPGKHTCDGADVSPPLAWSGVPPAARSLVLIADDPDAGKTPFAHWLVYGLSPTVNALAEGQLPTGARQGRNDFRKNAYNGPCPPPGKPHHYHFKVHALDIELSLESGATRAELLTALRGHVLAEGELVGVYQR
ncbi:MAG TPA: YbhB/YbcL family Raf kinase inhibitor-like protein [Longimicrobiales bacterium]|nr:YbhB/YbcL family Raf kinase inhibitor-like protein [Longimicrobiales bacterium]